MNNIGIRKGVATAIKEEKFNKHYVVGVLQEFYLNRIERIKGRVVPIGAASLVRNEVVHRVNERVVI